MAYKYYPAYRSGMMKTPKQDFRDDMQQNVDEVFYMSSNWYTIGEETDFGSETYNDLDVRLNTVVDSTTGSNKGDDWRRVTFKDTSKFVQVGQMYYFDNNYWVTTDTHAFSGITTASTIRRCNNTLRWIANDGKRYSVPCVLDYRIQENRDYSTGGSKLVNPSGILQIIVQRNNKTNLIKASNRFLFGNSENWTSYSVFGGGINNFHNQNTTDMTSGHLLSLTTGASHINEEVDDIVNGYANHGELLYSIDVDYLSLSAQSGQSRQLVSTVYLNGDATNGNVLWTTTDEAICTVDSSGLVTMVSDGSATIRASLDGDSTIYDECSVTVEAAPSDGYIVSVSPPITELLEGTSQTINVYLENNGVVQGDVFTFTVASTSVPMDKYSFATIDGNSFSVSNIEMYLDEPLVIRAISGIYIKDILITLRGAW